MLKYGIVQRVNRKILRSYIMKEIIRVSKRVISLMLICMIVIMQFSSSMTALAKNSGNQISEDSEIIDTDVYREKAKESLENWTLPDLAVLQGEFYSEYIIAQDLFYKGVQLESEDRYEEAQEAYQESLNTLENKRERLDEINKILKEVLSNPNGDYDKDGLLNEYEISAFYGYMNPIEAKSYPDGLNDGKDDFDLDGLSNLEEQTYGTSPISSDTDDDGIDDKRELELGLDPLNPKDGQTLVKQIIKSDDTGVSVEINAEGDAEGKVTVVKVESVFESSYAVTPFYNISSDVNYDTVKINIPVDLSNIPPKDYDKLWVVYYDEDLGGYIPIENSVVDSANGYVSAVTNQLALYSVFYVENWETYFTVPFNEPIDTHSYDPELG